MSSEHEDSPGRNEAIALARFLAIGSREAEQGMYCSVDDFKTRMANRYASPDDAPSDPHIVHKE